MRQRSFPLLFLPVYDVQNLRSGEGPIIKTAHRLQCLHGVSRGIKMQERSQTEKDFTWAEGNSARLALFCAFPLCRVAR